MREALTLGRQSVLLVATHLAERKLEAVRQEHRIVTEALIPARRPDQRTLDPALEFLGMSVRPCGAQHRDEMRPALLRREGIALAQAGLDLLHRAAEVLGLAGPACRINARRALERVGREP